MDEIKQNIAKNIVALRTAEHMTQAELAERLNYSDKAISKWERAESVPDVFVLKRVADMFGVTVDWLLSDNGGDRPIVASNRKTKNHMLITLISAAAVWFLALVVFVVCWIVRGAVNDLWLIFVAAVPVTSVLLLILNSVWGTRRRRKNAIIISVLIWSVLAFVFLLLICVWHMYEAWALFLLGIPAEVVVVLSHKIERTGKKKPSTSDVDNGKDN